MAKAEVCKTSNVGSIPTDASSVARQKRYTWVRFPPWPPRILSERSEVKNSAFAEAFGEGGILLTINN